MERKSPIPHPCIKRDEGRLGLIAAWRRRQRERINALMSGSNVAGIHLKAGASRHDWPHKLTTWLAIKSHRLDKKPLIIEKHGHWLARPV